MSDTIINNSRYPRALPVHALDAEGHIIAGAPIRFTWVDGAEVPVTNAGAVTCTKPGDLTVRAVLGNLTTDFFVRCRLVEHVQIQGPIRFILGDSALGQPHEFRVGVVGPDGRGVSLVTADVELTNKRIASLDGTMLTPLSQGRTVLGVRIGDREGGTGVHVYQRVDALDALDTLLRLHPLQRNVAVPLRLESGELFQQRLPQGHWTVFQLPQGEPGGNPIRVGVDDAACEPSRIDSGGLDCQTGSSASVVVYRPGGTRKAATATGYLLVRWNHEADPRRFVPRAPASPGSLACVKEVLAGQGYAVQRVSGEPLLRAERGDARLGTAVRREWIEVQVETSDTTLRGRAWAVDSYPQFESQLRAGGPMVVGPAEVTLTDADQVLQECGRRR